MRRYILKLRSWKIASAEVHTGVGTSYDLRNRRSIYYNNIILSSKIARITRAVLTRTQRRLTKYKFRLKRGPRRRPTRTVVENPIIIIIYAEPQTHTHTLAQKYIYIYIYYLGAGIKPEAICRVGTYTTHTRAVLRFLPLSFLRLTGAARIGFPYILYYINTRRMTVRFQCFNSRTLVYNKFTIL